MKTSTHSPFQLLAITFLTLLLLPTHVWAQGQLLDSATLAKAKTYTSLEEALKEPEKVYKLKLIASATIVGIAKGSNLVNMENINQFVNLQELTISQQVISKFPSFDKLKNLQSLDLSGTKVRTYENTRILFKGLRNLKALNIANVNLDSITSLKDLNKLKKLNIENIGLGNFSELEIGIFFQEIGDLDNLEDINISYNNLKTEHLKGKNCKFLRNLYRLSIKGNDLTFIPISIGKRLREVYCQNNKITMLSSNDSLEVLDISNNPLVDIDWMFKNYNLKKLYLNGVPLFSLPKSIGMLKQLELLDLSFCSFLIALPENFTYLTKLKELYLPSDFTNLLSKQDSKKNSDWLFFDYKVSYKLIAELKRKNKSLKINSHNNLDSLNTNYFHTFSDKKHSNFSSFLFLNNMTNNYNNYATKYINANLFDVIKNAIDSKRMDILLWILENKDIFIDNDICIKINNYIKRTSSISVLNFLFPNFQSTLSILKKKKIYQDSLLDLEIQKFKSLSIEQKKDTIFGHNYDRKKLVEESLFSKILFENPYLKQLKNNGVVLDLKDINRYNQIYFVTLNHEELNYIYRLILEQYANENLLKLDEDWLNAGKQIQTNAPNLDLPKPTAYHALIVAVQDYQDNTLDLARPIADADSVIKTLTTFYQFSKQNITYLKNPTRDQIVLAFDSLREKLTETDNLLIFYAGHGHWDDKLQRGYWLPADASAGNRTRWFSYSDLKDYVGSFACKHALLVTDACFAGSLILKDRNIDPATQKDIKEQLREATPYIRKLYAKKSRKVMTSGAMQAVPDNSVFMRYLLKYLRENSCKFLPASELFNEIRAAVINNSLKEPQFAPLNGAGDEGGEFIFIRKE